MSSKAISHKTFKYFLILLISPFVVWLSYLLLKLVMLRLLGLSAYMNYWLVSVPSAEVAALGVGEANKIYAIAVGVSLFISTLLGFFGVYLFRKNKAQSLQDVGLFLSTFLVKPIVHLLLMLHSYFFYKQIYWNTGDEFALAKRLAWNEWSIVGTLSLVSIVLFILMFSRLEKKKIYALGTVMCLALPIGFMLYLFVGKLMLP